MANPVTLRAWTVDDVGRWLSSINLTHLVHKFEVANITGDQLYRMDEGPLPQQIRLNPAEKLTLQASIRQLKESTARSMTIPPNSTRYGEISPRPRSSSDSKGKRKKTVRQCDSEQSGIDENLPPEPRPGPVGDLLDDHCRHSGWIRKRGGGYKSWKHRYLVLRLGFVYYFENDRSKQPKGHFSLYNCRVLPCSEEDKIPKQFKWVFKIVPNNPKHRTYLVTTPAKHEMDKWIDAINKEIQRFDKKVVEKSSPSEKETQEVEEEEEEESEQDYEHIYDPVYEDEDDEDDNHYEDPKDFYEDMTQEEDDPYSRVRDLSVNLPSPPSFPPPPDSHFSPPHASWQMADPKQPRKGKGDAPIIPPRSERSLNQAVKSEKLTKSPPHTPVTMEEDPYLRILGNNEFSGSHRMGGGNPTPRMSMTASPQLSPRPTHETTPINNGHPLSDSDIDPTEEEDPYYIRLQTFDEVLPQHCVFDNLSREDSDRLLMRSSRPGTYLLRDGTHKGAKYVLSVWTMNGSKHYKLYEKDTGYCLTEGKLFQTIYQLIEYYKQEDLPKTPDVKLNEPFHPADH